MTRDEIRSLAIQCGFTTRIQDDGSKDLNEYVYRFADLMFMRGRESAQGTVYGPIKQEKPYGL